MNQTQCRQRIGRYLGWADGCHQWEWIDSKGNWTRDITRAQVFEPHDSKAALEAVRKAAWPSQSYITRCAVE